MGLLTLNDLSGLGQVPATADCGPAPALGPGERRICCPDVGWVIYTIGESQYGLCERARAQIAGDAAAPAPSGDLIATVAAQQAAIQARKLALEERREALEEQRFQEQVQELQLRMQLAKVTAPERARAAKEAAERQREAARLRALSEERRRKQFLKAAGVGAAIWAAVKIFG